MAFLFVKEFVYLELLAVLALIRVVVGRGIARWPALVTLVLASAGMAPSLVETFNLTDGPLRPLYLQTEALTRAGGGMAALMIPSVVFLICSITPRARWRIIDAFHILMMLATIVLWWWAK
jgi:hypothetical protein